MSDAHRSEQPHDRLTRIADRLSDHLSADAENPADDVRAIFMLDDGGKGGLVLHGWEDDRDAMASLLLHVQAVFEANGMSFQVHPLGGQG